MEQTAILIGALILGVIAFIFGTRTSRKDTQPMAPPENTAAGAARGAIQQTFEDDVGRVKDAADGDSPASDLADLGNARRRR